MQENRITNNKNFIMMAILIATFMTSVETTIITTALPTIVSQLNGISLQSWVFATYLLLTAVTTPIYGKFADRIGRKPVFLTGLIIFTIGSFLCGVSNNMTILIIFRALQGIGAGAIMPITFTMIADLFDYQERSKMLAMNNTAWGISALLGPLLGGYIVDKLSWHWVFFINVPIGILVILIISFKYKEKRKEYIKRPLDIKGILSLSGLLILVLTFFQTLSQANVSSIQMLVILFLIVMFVIAFIIFERQASDPIIPFTLFYNRLFSIQVTTALLLSAIQIGFQTYFPMWLQSIYKTTATVAGLSVSPSPIFWLLSSFFVGTLVKRRSPKYITLPLIALMMVAYLPLLFIDSRFNQTIFFVISGITGVTLGITITMNTLVAQRIVPEESLGTASSMITLGRTLGQTLAAGIFGLVFNMSLNLGLKKHATVDQNMINQSIKGVYQSSSIADEHTINQIILTGMHIVFSVALILFVIVLIVNLADRNREVIK